MRTIYFLAIQYIVLLLCKYVLHCTAFLVTVSPTFFVLCTHFVFGAGLRSEHRGAHGDEHAEHPAAEECRVARPLHHGAQLRASQLLVSRAPLRHALRRTRAGAHHPQSLRREQVAARQHQSPNMIASFRSPSK